MLTTRPMSRKRSATSSRSTGLTLAVASGEVFGLLGPNGAGKSTSVSLAVGLLAPDCRQRHASRATATRPIPRFARRIGVAPQALSLYDLLTAEENLRFFGEVYGLSGAALDKRVRVVPRLRRRSPTARAIAWKAYSGGMKRRLNLAAALVHDPDLLAPRRADGRRRPAVAQQASSTASRRCIARAARSSTRRTTWKKPSGSAIASRSSMPASCSRSARSTSCWPTHGGPPTLVVQTQRRGAADADARSARRTQPDRSHRGHRRVPDGTATLEQVFLRLDRPQS